MQDWTRNARANNAGSVAEAVALVLLELAEALREVPAQAVHVTRVALTNPQKKRTASGFCVAWLCALRARAGPSAASSVSRLSGGSAGEGIALASPWVSVGVRGYPAQTGTDVQTYGFAEIRKTAFATNGFQRWRPGCA